MENAPKEKVTFVPFEGYYHELHNEPAADRAKVFETVATWINGKI
jgi:alpha-beta hydrolase superfamily lysophospholipase